MSLTIKLSISLLLLIKVAIVNCEVSSLVIHLLDILYGFEVGMNSIVSWTWTCDVC